MGSDGTQSDHRHALQGLQLPLSHSNLGTFKNPAATHSTGEQKLPSIQEAGSVCSTAALQGGLCQSGALNLCARYLGCCNTHPNFYHNCSSEFYLSHNF